MLSGHYLVKKTAPLIYAEWSTLGVNELKIVEVYLSRIDIKKGKTTVKFTKKEFADLMGYADSRNLKTKVFDERLAKFLSQQIRIDLDDGTGYHRFTLFSDAKCYYDPSANMAMVELDCNAKLAPVFLDLADGEKSGYRYISYRVEKTKKMDSAYSIRLYNLLLDHAWGNYKWVVEIEELRNLLGATAASYKSYKYFNARLLKKAQEEINNQTDIYFDYEPILNGKKYASIVFKIQKRKETDKMSSDEDKYDLPETEFSEQESLYDIPKSNLSQKQNESMIEIFRECIEMVNKNWKITDAQILEIGNKIYAHLPRVVEYYIELPVYKRDIYWINFLDDMLRKAAAEEAKNLYKFLISQWDRYICEINARGE